MGYMKKLFDFNKKSFLSAVLKLLLFLLITPFLMFFGGAIDPLVGVNILAAILLLIFLKPVTNNFKHFPKRTIPAILLLSWILLTQLFYLLVFRMFGPAPFWGFAGIAYPLFTLSMMFLIKIHENLLLDLAIKIIAFILLFITFLSFVFMS